MLKLKDTDRHIVDGISELLESAGGLPRVRRLQAGTQSFDRAAWGKLAEHGWLGAAVPEAQGGTGLGMREVALLLEHAGKKLMPEPLVPALAASVMLARNGAAGAPLLAELVAGKTVVAPIEAWEGSKGPTDFAADGHAADVFVTLIDDKLVAIPRQTKDVTVETQDTVDGGSIARLKFDGVTLSGLTALASGEQARDAFRAGRDLALLGYTALLVGLADEALAMTVQYLKDRKQFGVPIGSFQALQHRAASLYVLGKASRALLYEACRASAARRSIAVFAAKSYAAENAMTTVKECVQLHGAMGYTAEHNMSLYFRRAMALAVAGGDAITCRKRLHAERQLSQDS
ncbi:MAG TPA: acyl-CoA dehydrogenase [Stellaceae bacterium]|jgi:alkylation response protein AidB-like acyl-CoA dehydrogenase|nr:acyl-CoA dehydrogenase [Stellaceae bacterium]